MIDLKHLGHELNGFIEEVGAPIANQDFWTSKPRENIFIKKDGSLFPIGHLDWLGLSPLG